MRTPTRLSVVVEDRGRFPSPTSVISDHLPDHLGWGNPAITALLQSATISPKKQTIPKEEVATPRYKETTLSKTRTPISPLKSATIKLYPDLGLGMLRQEQAAAGRIWLLLHYLDKERKGWLYLEETREKLTQKEGALRVCGWRQLRNLLNQGEGFFWTRGNGRIWVRSVAKVAAALGVRRLTLQPVSLPVMNLLEGIGQVRAHLYASLHSSRGKHDSETAPIARDTVARISHVPQRTQRFYEQRAKVRTRRNFAVGPQANEIESETQAWRQGTAAFPFVDPDGWHGRKGRTYIAWQLPNNYAGPHAKQPRGRMKRINHELADLFMKGMTGNDEEQVEDNYLPKRFFGNGRLAAKASKKAPNRDIYWKRSGEHQQTQPTGYQLWYVLNK